jgi:hypothetical protein
VDTQDFLTIAFNLFFFFFFFFLFLISKYDYQPKSTNIVYEIRPGMEGTRGRLRIQTLMVPLMDDDLTGQQNCQFKSNDHYYLP